MNARIGSILIACIAATAIAGCASGGNRIIQNESAATVERKLARGQSTKQSVRKFYGDPVNVSFTDSGNEIWKYEFTEVNSTAASFIPVVNLFTSGIEGYKKELVVFFDRSGVVQNFTLNRSAIDSKSGLVPQ